MSKRLVGVNGILIFEAETENESVKKAGNIAARTFEKHSLGDVINLDEEDDEE